MALIVAHMRKMLEQLAGNPIEVTKTCVQYYGWFQTLFREKVKSPSRGNRTLNSDSA